MTRVIRKMCLDVKPDAKLNIHISHVTFMQIRRGWVKKKEIKKRLKKESVNCFYTINIFPP